jgi:hypothetical protein
MRNGRETQMTAEYGGGALIEGLVREENGVRQTRELGFYLRATGSCGQNLNQK